MSSNEPEIKIEPEEDELISDAPTGLMSRSTM